MKHVFVKSKLASEISFIYFYATINHAWKIENKTLHVFGLEVQAMYLPKYQIA